jgi:hypothetical protein
MSINSLTRTTTLSLADLVPLWPASAQDDQVATLATLLAFLQANLTTGADIAQQYASPAATGFTVVVTVGNTWLVLSPLAGYAAGTITLPANPTNEQIVQVSCTQAVTTLTVGGNGRTVIGAPATIAAGGFFTMRYDLTTNAWYRVS